MVYLFNWDFGWFKLIGILVVLFLSIINIIGMKYGGIVQGIMIVGKLILIICMIVFGFWKGDQYIFIIVISSMLEMNFGAVILVILFVYDGWIFFVVFGGEMKNLEKLFLKVMIGGLLVVIVIYFFINFVLLYIFFVIDIVKFGENVIGIAVGMLFGDIGGKLISVGIIVSIFGCLNGKIFVFLCVLFVMVEWKQFLFVGQIL